jgi:hypothetical protein
MKPEAGGEVYDRHDGAIGDRLGQRTTDRHSLRSGRRRLDVRPDGQESRKIDTLVGSAEIIPRRFVAKIKQGAGDQREG